MPNGGVYRRSPDGNIETLIPKRRGVGGIALNEGGGIVCTGRGLIYWNEASRTSRDLFVEWEGRKLNGLNDLSSPTITARSLSDRLEHNALEEGAKRIPGSLFRVDPDGSVTKLYEGIETTNGMGFSPDRKFLYHADSTTKAVWVYDVQPDRTVKDRRIFARMPQGWPDGLAIDAEGGVCVAIVNYGDVVRFKPDGTLDWRLNVPAHMVTSVTFGGPDLRDLYIVTADNLDDKTKKGTIFRTRVTIPGWLFPRPDSTEICCALEIPCPPQ